MSAVAIQLMSPALVEAMEDCARAIRRVETLTAERDSWPARMESALADVRSALRVVAAESKGDG